MAAAASGAPKAKVGWTGATSDGDGGDSMDASELASAWDRALGEAAAPAHAAYKARTQRRKATDDEAIAERDGAIASAWVALGIDSEHAAAAL